MDLTARTLQATEEIRVFIDKKIYGNTPDSATDVGKIPNDRRESISWKGCYYTIKPKEKFRFDRGNGWDRIYLQLENGAEFMVECGDPESFIKRCNIVTIK